MEEYEEVETEFTTDDYVFLGFVVVAASILIVLIFRAIRKTFKNVHLKIGNKVEIGIETK